MARPRSFSGSAPSGAARGVNGDTHGGEQDRPRKRSVAAKRTAKSHLDTVGPEMRGARGVRAGGRRVVQPQIGRLDVILVPLSISLPAISVRRPERASGKSDETAPATRDGPVAAAEPGRRVPHHM